MAGGAKLEVIVDGGLPEEISVGRGTCAVLRGTCQARPGRVRSVRLLVNGAEQPFGGVNRRLTTPDGRRRWWAVADLPRVSTPEAVAIQLEARVGLRARARESLGRIRIVPGWQPGQLDYEELAEHPNGSVTGALTLDPAVAVCVATETPDLESFGRLIGALEAQTYENWHCIICDVGSPAEHLTAMRERIGDSGRFLLFSGDPGEGLHGGYAQAMMRVPSDVPYLAVAEPGARWHPAVLATLLGAMAPECNAVVAEASGEAARNGGAPHGNEGHPLEASLASIAFGVRAPRGAMLFRRQLLRYALPLPPAGPDAPPQPWITLLASAVGGVGVVGLPTDAAPESSNGAPTAEAQDARLGRVLSSVVPMRILEARVGAYLPDAERRQVRRVAGADSPLRLWFAARSG